MEMGITEGMAPPLIVVFWLTPSVLLRSVCFSLTLSNPLTCSRPLLACFDDADADSTALLGPMAGMGGHTTVGSLVLRPYLWEEQHGARGKGQGPAILDPVDLRWGLGGGFTGQGHSTTRSYCSPFWLYHQLDFLQWHSVWGWEGDGVESPTCVWSQWPQAEPFPS